ncbi:MAG: adenylate/guanylate cyclase domain-containing protein [Acidimicrobiia bacterium]
MAESALERGARLEPATAADLIEDARAAIGRHAWVEALELFTRADKEEPLSGSDLEAMAEAAFFAAQADVAIEAKERAFKAYQVDGNRIRAATLALDLFDQYSYKGKPSIAAAWMRRGEKLLEDEPESYAHGYLALTKAFAARANNDIDGALAQAELAVQIGERSGDVDLVAFSMTVLGSLRIATGAVSNGFELMEEAAVAAINGELSAFTAGITCCNMIAACRDLSDYQRAREWTEATEKWCEREGVGGFPGVCRVHRAEVVALTGAWERAEEELRRATSELASYNAAPPMGDGFYAIADIRLRKGDLEGAEEALRQAHALGRDPQPALARIRLAQGKVRAAATGINSALAQQSWDKWARTRLLPAQIEIAIASGDVALARRGAEELTELVDTYQTPAMQAGKHEAWGRVHLADGDADGAAHELREAIHHWREVAAPYEIARARALLASALRSLHDDDGADLEIATARSEFARLGARIDELAAAKAMQIAADRSTAPVQTTKAFMFTDIVGSTNLAEMLGNEAWEQLLQWHDDALRELFARHGGEVVHSTGDGFFVAFDSAKQGIECAVAVQRELAEHRRTSGFAPMVRIGVHAAEANRRGDDYSGIGVHVAARVAALAGAGEVFVSTETLRGAEDFSVSEPREVALKGVAEPITIVSVAWN